MKHRNPYVQAKNPITDEWIKIDTRVCTIINHRNFPYLYTPFATSEYADMAREVHRKRKEHVRDIEYSIWFGARQQ